MDKKEGIVRGLGEEDFEKTKSPPPPGIRRRYMDRPEPTNPAPADDGLKEPLKESSTC